MNRAVDQLLSRYQNGHITRRELLAALALLAAPVPHTSASAAPAVGPVKSMNHVSIFVPDVQKSKQFYQDLLGLPLLTNQPPGVNLSTGPSFLGIYPAQNGQRGSINHVCLGIENFNAESVLKTLQARELQARIRLRGDTQELYFTDPDGILIQLQDPKYIGGVGPLGDKPPE